ncbi:MAG: Asp23/Gls24 family envelope stress response protein [Actinomycetota bacterium]|nr:Asp23/Gls24 family envelope stress response protein [Actinomycetota bacterium]
MSRRGDSDPDERETKEFEVAADAPDEGDAPVGAGDDPTRLEEIPVVEESSIRDDPLGETAAAAWAAGATPPPDMIPGDQAETKAAVSPETPETPEREGGLQPFVPDEDPQPLESGGVQGSFAPAAETSDPSLKSTVWDEGEVRLPGAEDPLATPELVEPAPATFSPAPSAEVGEDVPSSDLLITERGHTIITPRVVEKIAGRSASEVDGVGGVHSSGLGRFADLFSGSEKRETQAHAEVDRASTVVDLVVSVRYPEPVGAVANRVRQHVIKRLHELTGLQVGEVNVTISELVVPSAPPPRPRVI